MDVQNAYIYALIDPITNEIRYIGKTINPKIRYTDHLCKCKKKKTHKDSWIYSLRMQKLKPKISILEKCNINNWQEREKFYISQYNNLTNLTNGGNGPPHGLTHTNKTINPAFTFKGHTHSAETKKQMSVNRSGHKNSFFNKKHTVETKLKIAQSNQLKNTGKNNPFYGKKHTDITRKKISDKAKELRKNGKGNKFKILYGKENPAAKERTFISPNNEIIKVYSIKKFCDENNLSITIVMRNINKGKIIMPTDKLFLARQRAKSKNTVGWEIIE